MRDALGGTVNVVIIVMFIVIALGYITFNINYTKAFRVNDKIVSLYKKPLTPSNDELKGNNRSRSAKLRVAEKKA